MTARRRYVMDIFDLYGIMHNENDLNSIVTLV